MKRVAIVAMGIVTALALSPVASQGGAFEGPDAEIRGGLTDNYKGDGIQNASGDMQVARGRTRIGRKAIFQIKVTNLDVDQDDYDVSACNSNSNFKITYKADGQSFGDEDFDLDDLAGGNSNDDLRLHIKVKDSAEVGDVKKCKTLFESVNNPGRVDAVKARDKVKAG
ncbi:MAG: hypothetical protein WD276_00185 [Actinomycetota bacterium]